MLDEIRGKINSAAVAALMEEADAIGNPYVQIMHRALAVHVELAGLDAAIRRVGPGNWALHVIGVPSAGLPTGQLPSLNQEWLRADREEVADAERRWTERLNELKAAAGLD